MAETTPTFDFEVDGRVYRVDLENFTGIDARQFRKAVGMALTTALAKISTGEIDPLEFVAGFKWLEDKKETPGLKFDDVLGSLTYESVNLAPEPTEEEVEDDPPTPGEDSGNSSLASPISSGSNPGTSRDSVSVR